MMDIKIIFSGLAIILTFLAYVAYIKDILKGKTTPHAYTWLIFCLVNAFVFALQLMAGAGIGSFVSLVISITFFVIFILSLFKGEKHITFSDTIFFVLALMSFILWIITKQSVLSVVLLSIINIFAFIPTIRKSWNKPFSETILTYIINTVRYGIALLALEQYNFVTYFFPLVALITTFIFVFILIIRRKIIS
jgi:hypothetical protein